MKICRKCNTEKELSLYPKDKVCKDGISNICKECHKLKNKEYHNKNKEERKKYKTEYYLENKSVILENSKEYYMNNKEEKDLACKQYYLENKEKIKEKRKNYYLDNKPTILENLRIKYSNTILSDEELEKRRLSSQKHYSNNKEDIHKRRKEIHRMRLKTDIIYRLSLNMRTSIRESLKSNGYRKCQRTEEILGISIIEFKKYLESKFEDWMNWENRGLYNGELNYGWDIDHIIPISSAKTEGEAIRLNHYKNLQPLCSKVNRDIKRDIVDYK
jgi:hypothetical protein